MKIIISVKDLVKNYGDFQAVKSISFDVMEGEIFGCSAPMEPVSLPRLK
jgi:ABC-2 type transport system ATP-binding protein